MDKQKRIELGENALVTLGKIEALQEKAMKDIASFVEKWKEGSKTDQMGSLLKSAESSKQVIDKYFEEQKALIKGMRWGDRVDLRYAMDTYGRKAEKALETLDKESWWMWDCGKELDGKMKVLRRSGLMDDYAMRLARVNVGDVILGAEGIAATMALKLTPLVRKG